MPCLRLFPVNFCTKNILVVVAVVEAACAAEEVDVLFPVLVVEERPLGGGEYRGEVAAVGAHLGLVLLEGLGVHGSAHQLPSFLPRELPVIQRSTPGKSPDGAVCLPREASGKRPMRVVLDFGLGLSYHKAGGKKRNFFLNF